MWFIVAAFVTGTIGFGWFLRRREQEGAFDAGPSSVSRPGLRRFFDFGDGGWSDDGVNQRPPPS